MRTSDPIEVQLRAESLYALGLRYALGRELPRDVVAAHACFNLAAKAGHRLADQAKAEISLELDTAQLKRAQARARDWARA